MTEEVPRPRALAERLTGLSVEIEAAMVATAGLALPEYPDEPRPIGVVSFAGRGEVGHGENVAFTRAEQAAFAALVAAAPAPTRGSVAEVILGWERAGVDGHGRAAIEAALIDLAMKQAGLSLADLTGRRALPLRRVVSFAARADAAAHLRALRAAGRGDEFKIDVDLAWPPSVQAALAHEPAIVIFDFKGAGDPGVAARLAQGAALLEDPPPGTHGVPADRIARDRSLATPADVATAVARGEAINLKAPRMGGPLALLVALDHAREAGARVYLGGMFEVGPGRIQARQLAALYCGEGPNDLATVPGALAASPASARADRLIRLDGRGFGDGTDWRRAVLDASGTS